VHVVHFCRGWYQKERFRTDYDVVTQTA
jgi:hypothetical protein